MFLQLIYPVFPVHPSLIFPLVTSESLCAEVSRMKASTCILDPLHSSLFKSCFGYVCFKTAAVTPILKKQNSDWNNLCNFRPISHLPFIAKI